MRYRSAIRAKREIDPDEAVNYRMMHIVSIDEPGLITRGYHRVIHGATKHETERLLKRIEQTCDVEVLDRNVAGSRASDLLRAVGTRDDGEFVFGLYGLSGGFRICRMRGESSASLLGVDAAERSDYRRLHSEILDFAFGGDRIDATVDFEYEVENVVGRVDSSEAQLGIVMRSIPMREFVDIVTRGDRLPPKATNFYPKPPAGAVIQSLEGDL